MVVPAWCMIRLEIINFYACEWHLIQSFLEAMVFCTAEPCLQSCENDIPVQILQSFLKLYSK